MLCCLLTLYSILPDRNESWLSPGGNQRWWIFILFLIVIISTIIITILSSIISILMFCLLKWTKVIIFFINIYIFVPLALHLFSVFWVHPLFSLFLPILPEFCPTHFQFDGFQLNQQGDSLLAQTEFIKRISRKFQYLFGTLFDVLS